MENETTFTKFGNSFQSKVVSALLTDGKFLEKLSEILSPNKYVVFVS